MSDTSTALDRVFVEHERELSQVSLDEALMHFEASDKLMILIDGSNFYYTTKRMNFRVDYIKLLQFFRERSRLTAAYFFAAVSSDPHHEPLRNLMKFLGHNGYRVRSRESLKADATSWKGNMDVDITVTGLLETTQADHVVLFSGDGDFIPLVRAMQARGQKVTVIASAAPDRRDVSLDLQREVDRFIDIDLLAPKIESFRVEPVNPV